ncbi:MAG: alpha/beta hydrolase [Pseudomonadota bacterium]
MPTTPAAAHLEALPDLFPGFEHHTIAAGEVKLNLRTGGRGPALVLLHGYPQTHVCWHAIAPALAEHFTLIIPDLRGYGRSEAPPADEGHLAYAKRTMAADIVALMRALGHERFMLAGHDRGGRVAYRLALDHAARVSRLVLLDIVPTSVQWQHLTAQKALSGYHWQFLAQPSPMPETLIGADPAYYVQHTIASWTRTKDLSAFAQPALAHYRAALMPPERRMAVCEDYRAGATIDWRLDVEDEAAARRIDCPTLVLWGDDYLGKGAVDVLGTWRHWCRDVRGMSVRSGHFLAEEATAEVSRHMLSFLQA